MAQSSEKIARLNDLLRQEGIGGRVMVTRGIAALAQDTRQRIFQAVREFDGFSKDNDPYKERDFAALTVEGNRINWKIDYYNKDLTAGSEDPSNPTITERIMTIMLASEY